MNEIPNNLRMKMMVDAIVLLKMRNGWTQIHHNIKKSSLYLKKTTTIIIPHSMNYEHILRANTTIYFTYGKTFTWLKQKKSNPNIYYYSPPYIDSYGYFFDDIL
tara:strand:+ start:6056 stop:6367 length:312 start_codon:yes stop_codon:yes gene_type:complete